MSTTTRVKQRRAKHVPHKDLPTEVAESRNGRERMRVTHVNQAFAQLQHLLPTIKHRTRRVSKERILLLAIQYINGLKKLLEEDQTNIELRGSFHTPSDYHTTTAFSEHHCSDLNNRKMVHQMPGSSGADSWDHACPEMTAFVNGRRPFSQNSRNELRMKALEDAILSSEPIYADVKPENMPPFHGNLLVLCQDEPELQDCVRITRPHDQSQFYQYEHFAGLDSTTTGNKRTRSTERTNLALSVKTSMSLWPMGEESLSSGRDTFAENTWIHSTYNPARDTPHSEEIRTNRY